jgi:ferredoxin
MEMSDFVGEEAISCPDGILEKQFLMARGILAADGIVNLPKFKTHGLTRMTGAVKNLFGCLPGVQKAGFHARLPNEDLFGEMLLDLESIISPRLHIMDGIWGMEGNGPRNGRLRKVGVILISANPHALDHCVARLMNLDPELVPTLKAAQGYGRYQPEEIEVLGEELERLIMPDFDVNRSRISTTAPRGFYMDLFKNWVTPRPVIDPEKCSHCGRCVAVCPATPKALGFLNGRSAPPQYNYDNCIRCYCCQEMCPDEAIFIETPVLGRLFNKINL